MTEKESVVNGDFALVGSDYTGEAVQDRSFACTGSAFNDQKLVPHGKFHIEIEVVKFFVQFKSYTHLTNPPRFSRLLSHIFSPNTSAKLKSTIISTSIEAFSSFPTTTA